jgi:hypothetical protein
MDFPWAENLYFGTDGMDTAAYLFSRMPFIAGILWLAGVCDPLGAFRDYLTVFI